VNSGGRHGRIRVEGRGVEPLAGPAPETASGTTRPPRRRGGLNSRPFRLRKLTEWWRATKCVNELARCALPSYLSRNILAR
jgi:hypothetical protein